MKQKTNLSFLNSIENKLTKIKIWFKSGNPPPKTQIKSLYLALFLFLFGISVFTFFILSYFKIYFYEFVSSNMVLLLISFLTLCPSIYAFWISYHCWRKYPGYDWWIIPHYE